MPRILPAFLLLLAACVPAHAQPVDAMSSIFLVAKKDMRDPFFRESVVLVTHRAGPGPVGIIINRRTKLAASKALPEAAKRPEGERVFFGGPVAADELVILFRSKDAPKDAVEVLEGVYFSIIRNTIREVLARDPPVKDLRLLAGYAGWARGQLEAEVARGDWHLVRADAATIFEKNPETLWRELERASGGKPTFAPE